MSKYNIAQLWDYFIALVYNRTAFVEELSDLLKGYSGPILDCACGTGFPATDLKKRGFDVYCSDSSDTMLEQFRRNMKKEGIKIPYANSRWQDLSKNLPESWPKEFSVVLCRGGSLEIADAWGTENQTTYKSIEDAVAQFYRCLGKGRLLYLDYDEFQDIDSDEQRIVTSYDGKVGSKAIRIRDQVRMIRDSKEFFWEPTFYIDGVEHKLQVKGRLLSFDYLSGLLGEVGFKVVTKVKLKYEPIFKVILACK